MTIKVLLAPTEDFIKRDKTKVASNVLPGSNVVIPTINANDYNVNDYIVIGVEGSEAAELQKITAVAGQNVTVAVLKFNHFADEPIVKYRYNARKFYGSTTQTGTYAELTGYGSPVTIQVNDPQGTILEYTGGEGYLYFKATYWNTQTSEETSIADAEAVLANEATRYCSIYAIRKQAGLTNNPFITDGIIETYRKRAENEVKSYIFSKYILPLVNSSGVAEVPAMIENCTTLLAAGYMDYQEFGKDGEGVKWLGEARSILKQLQGPGGQTLLGSDDQEMQVVTNSMSVQSFPDSVDNDPADDGPQQKFTMTQRF